MIMKVSIGESVFCHFKKFEIYSIAKHVHTLSYGISYIHLKSCWLTQESLEHDPFSTFGLICPNSICEKNLTKNRNFLYWMHLDLKSYSNDQVGSHYVPIMNI